LPLPVTDLQSQGRGLAGTSGGETGKDQQKAKLIPHRHPPDRSLVIAVTRINATISGFCHMLL
jgi:hypothetical protein